MIGIIFYFILFSILEQTSQCELCSKNKTAQIVNHYSTLFRGCGIISLLKRETHAMRFLPFERVREDEQAGFIEIARTSNITHVICREFKEEGIVKVFDTLTEDEVDKAHMEMVGEDYEEYALIEIPLSE